MRSRIASGLAILLVLLLPGCAYRAKVPAERTHVIVWSGWVGIEQEAFEHAVDMFNASQDRYYLENRSTVEDDTRIFRAITAGTPPDFFFLWRTSYIGALAANGAVRPLDEFMQGSRIREDDFIPGALEQCRYHGKLYAVPFLIDAAGLYWNRDVFGEAGLDPDHPPETLEELLDLAVKLTKRDERGNLVRLGFQPPPIHEVMALFGGQLTDPETGRITANHPRNVEALEWYVRMCDVQGGGLRMDSFKAGFGEYNSPNHQFFVGKVAIMFNGEWWPSYVTRYSPTTDYAVTSLPYPRKYPQYKGTTFLGGNFAAIPTESEHPEGAWAFIEWMQSRRAQVEFSKVMHGLPNVRSAIFAPELTEGNREKEAFGEMCRIAALGKGAIFPPTPVNVAYMTELETVAQRAARKAVTPRDGLEQVQQRLEVYMEPYRGL
ncbi:MAG: ABC transporter substrate-binding protein [Armatimonadota bacterium]|nr:MAG: ABC transporter substrate-binding protein [Armatimonadota bacterium]